MSNHLTALYPYTSSASHCVGTPVPCSFLIIWVDGGILRWRCSLIVRLLRGTVGAPVGPIRSSDRGCVNEGGE